MTSHASNALRTQGRRGLQLIALGVVIGLTSSLISEVSNWLTDGPSVDGPTSLAWRVGMWVTNVIGLAGTVAHVWGMVKLSRLPKMRVAVAAWVTTLVSTAGHWALGLLAGSIGFSPYAAWGSRATSPLSSPW